MRRGCARLLLQLLLLQLLLLTSPRGNPWNPQE